jgi:hypothetical protein
VKYLVAVFFLIFAVINGRRIVWWIREGEAYLIVSAGGDGLLGGADRNDHPVAFWFNIAANSVVAAAAAIGGIWILLDRVDF